MRTFPLKAVFKLPTQSLVYSNVNDSWILKTNHPEWNSQLKKILRLLGTDATCSHTDLHNSGSLRRTCYPRCSRPNLLFVVAMLFWSLLSDGLTTKEKFIDTIQKIDMPFCSYYKSKYDPFYSIVAIGGTDTLQVLIKLKSHKYTTTQSLLTNSRLLSCAEERRMTETP